MWLASSRGHWNVTCVLRRTVPVPPYSFSTHFPNHLRKWLQEKNKPLMVVVARSFPIAAIIAFPVQNHSVCTETRQRMQQPSQNGKAYLFLINFWHIVLNWMHSTHTDDSFSPPLWDEMEQHTVHIFQTILNKQIAKWDLYNGPQTPLNDFIGGEISVSLQISKCNND